MSTRSDFERWIDTFKTETSDHRVFVYAKGEKNLAACGFSARVMHILNEMGVDYAVRNVLVDPVIRQALSAWTGWPTIPQVFVDGKLVGGCDILVEMHESGELRELLSGD
jgi:monothiol glutaredoxin